MTAPLGPFQTSSEALLAVRPDDGSFFHYNDRYALLQDTMHAAGVELGEWDETVLAWLCGQDVQTVAAVAGWVQRGGGIRDGLADEDGPDGGEGAAVHGLSCGCPECDNDEAEPYCVTCGADVGIFIGQGDAWLHYTGQGTAASPVELYDAGHAPEVAWRPAGAR